MAGFGAGGWPAPGMGGFGASGWPIPGMGGPWAPFGFGSGSGFGPGPGARLGPGSSPESGESRGADWTAGVQAGPAVEYIFPEVLLPGYLTIWLMAASVPETSEPVSPADEPDVIEVVAGPPAPLASDSDAAAPAAAALADRQFLPAVSADEMTLWAEAPVELLADEPVDQMDEGEA